MSTSSAAVFLSYASEDAAAAERIARALRDAGIEVWFDKTELRGGDAWDRQIRKQIHDCALFIPIISVHSQARLEGYFRREWKLAADRTHDMAEEKAFLVPVVIDDTTERNASVPEKFRDVQWTRLPAGETPPPFADRVSRLLAPEAAHGSAEARSSAAIPHATTPPRQLRRSPSATQQTQRVLLMIAAVAVIGIGYIAVDKLWLSKRVAAGSQTASGQGGAAAQSARPEKSIAVLPFVDLSEKKDQEYFSDGLSEELIDLLTKVPDLHVPARTSSFFFKGKPDDIATIAQKLRVANVLEGSVRKAANTIRVTAQLIRADSGYHLWSETYERDFKDVFKVQDEIAGAVVTALKVKLEPGQQISSSHRTSIPEAYNHYLLGNQFMERWNTEGFRLAAEAYRKAIELDPRYAAAYAKLAGAEFYIADDGGDIAGKQQALAVTEKAIELAPDAADGYSTRGFLRSQFSWDWAGAEADFEKALAIDSGHVDAQAGYATLLFNFGRLPESIAAFKKWTQLDPLSSNGWRALGEALIANRQFKTADEALRRSLEIQPEGGVARNDLGDLQLLEGNAAEALATFGKVVDYGEYRLAGLAMASHTLGHAKESQQALDELIAKHTREASYYVAEVYAWRGQKDKAFEWLERAYQQRENDLTFIKTDPLLDSLHGDSRFGAFLRKMNLPE